MPFPYASRDQLERELQYVQADFPGVQDESDWNGLLDDALETESERVEGDAYAGADWRDATATVPLVVELAVIRLARQRIAAIREDGISSEDLVSGAGYDYRPPSAIRAEIRQALSDAGYTTRYSGSATPNQ
jgi:hypothetical protein